MTSQLYLGNNSISTVTINSPEYCVEKINDNGTLRNNTKSLINLDGISTIGSYGLAYAYANSETLTTAPDFSNIKHIESNGCYQTFCDCTNLESIDLSSLEIIDGSGCYSMLQRCNKLTSLDLHNLYYVDGSGCYNMVQNCKNLESIDLSNVMGVSTGSFCGFASSCSKLSGIIDLGNLISMGGSINGGNGSCSSMFSYSNNVEGVNLSKLTYVNSASGCSSMFSGCTKITSVSFDKLMSCAGNGIFSSMFSSCTSLKHLYFPSLHALSFDNSYNHNRNQFSYMINGVTGCTIHFPSNLDPQTGCTTISSLLSYPKFGGTNTTVLYDLPATE